MQPLCRIAVLHATDVGEDLAQVLRICIFTHENHTPKGNANAKAPFAGENTTIWQAYATCMSRNSLTQPYAFQVFAYTPKFHMTKPLLSSSWENSNAILRWVEKSNARNIDQEQLQEHRIMATSWEMKVLS